MRTVHEVSRLAGVSVRTLHHYDAIGLLKPSAITEAGYRLYDDMALERLQTILLYRELKFPLKEIKAILGSPGFQRGEALRQQLELLKLERERLDELIALAENLIEGDDSMSFTAFDRSRLEEYAAQAKQKWGGTPAFQEYEQRGGTTPDALSSLEAIFVKMGEARQVAPASPKAQALVEELRQCITENFYTCSPEILRSLGEMYASRPDFTRNIDQAGGEGTAQFAHKAIAAYCEKQGN